MPKTATTVAFDNGFTVLLTRRIGAPPEEWEAFASLLEAAPEMRAALIAALACIERQREIANLVALGDFSTPQTDDTRHEMEIVTDFFEAELRALLTRINPADPFTVITK